jgi:hypothetical protein
MKLLFLPLESHERMQYFFQYVTQFSEEIKMKCTPASNTYCSATKDACVSPLCLKRVFFIK